MVSVEVAYTEQRENHGTMILHGVSYSGLYPSVRVILYVWNSPV